MPEYIRQNSKKWLITKWNLNAAKKYLQNASKPPLCVRLPHRVPGEGMQRWSEKRMCTIIRVFTIFWVGIFIRSTGPIINKEAIITYALTQKIENRSANCFYTTTLATIFSSFIFCNFFPAKCRQFENHNLKIWTSFVQVAQNVSQ